MSTADILAVTNLAWPAVAVVLGWRIIPQIRVAAPKPPETLRSAEAVKSIAAARRGAAS